MTVLRAVGIGTLLLLLVTFATIGILYTTRGTPVTTVRTFGDAAGPPAVEDPSFAETVQLLSDVTLMPGHDIEVMINGDQTYPRLWEELRAARTSLTLQMYYVNPGRMADTLRNILLDRARAGVRVLFLHDAFGAQNLGDDYIESLRAGGVRVAVFRPVHWYSLHKTSHRSHIRVVVVDGRVGYTGGFGIDDKWFGDGRHPGQWRDTNVRFTGPAVMQLQATFAAGWAEATGELMTGEAFFPSGAFRAMDAGSLDGRGAGARGGVHAPEGSVPVSGEARVRHALAALMHASPTIGSTAAERFLAMSIAGARKRLYITNSYFVPDDDFRRLLVEAARRGTDVRILTTSDETDVRTTWLAGRARYEQLLEGGIRIYEYQPVMMHAKTFVADGLWGTVGTMNFDNRSMVFNDESNLVVLDRHFAARLEEIFLEDLQYAREIKLEEFRRRGVWAKVQETGASMLSRLL